MRIKICNVLLLLALMLLPQKILAADAKGDWAGTLVVSPSISLRLAVHISPGEDGKLQGTMDSLDQGARGIPLADIEATPESLAFAVPSIGGRYQGKWDEAKNAWVGEWSQGGAPLPLELSAAPPPAPPAPLPANWEIPSDDQIGKLLEQRIAERPGAGFVVGVIEPSGSRVVARGPAGKQPFDKDSVFEIGSMTKVFTALLLADMVERGEVALEDPAGKYLPAGATMPERAGRKITLLDLATHRSGLPRLPDNLPMSNMDDPYADYTEAQLLEFLSQHDLTRDIGSQYEYSNLGMGLLGYLLARRAGTDYQTLLKTRITCPLGMDDTTISLTPAQKARFAQGHDMFMRAASPWDVAVLAGAGGIRSTVDDMARFIDAFIDGSHATLAPAMKAMLAQRWPAMNERFETGLGWLVAKSPAGDIVMHDGGTGGFRSSMAFDPAKKRGVVVMTNSAVEPAVNDLSIHLLVGTPVAPLQPIPAAPPAAKVRTEVSLPASELDRVVGSYQFAPGMVLDIMREGDGLRAQLTGQPRFPIFAEAPLRFFWKVVDAQLGFTTDQSGKVTGVVLYQNGQELTGQRIGS